MTKPAIPTGFEDLSDDEVLRYFDLLKRERNRRLRALRSKQRNAKKETHL